MNRPGPSTREGGFLMVVVLGIMAVLVVLVGALQHQGLAARQATVLMEAKYLAERCADSLRGQLESSLEKDLPTGVSRHYFTDQSATSITVGPDPTGSLDRNSVYIDSDNYYLGGKESAAHIFEDPERLAIGNLDKLKTEESLQGRDRILFPQTLRVEGRPTSWNPTYDLFKRNRYQSVLVAGFPYAAFAPGENQSVEIEKLGTWTLPALDQHDEEFHPLEHNSGLAPYVGAGGDVTVQDFPYGRAFTTSGTIDCRGQVVGFKGFLPYQTWGTSSYFDLLESSLSDTASKLSRVSTDKTGAIFGRLSLKDTMKLIFKGTTPRNFLTYQSAASWWFFLLPEVRPDGPSLKIALHTPLPADQGALADVAGSSLPLAAIANLEEKNRKLEKELLPDSVPEDEADWDQSTPGLIPQLSWQAKQYQAVESERDALRSELEALRSRGASDSAIASKEDEIERKEEELALKRDDLDELDLKVQRKQEQLEHHQDEIAQLTNDLEDQMKSWIQGDPKGPNQLVEFVMKHTKVGEPVNTDAYQNKPPAKRKSDSRDGNKDDKTALLSNKGMLYHSYAVVFMRLGNELKRILKRAVTSFPMKTTKIKLPGKTIKFKVPNFKKLPQWYQSVGDSLAEGLQNLVVYEVPVLFMDGVPLEKIGGSHFKIRDTFQVPPGRTFRLTGDMTVRGDLWLQRGSSMTVSGNLTMVKPLGHGIPVFGEMMQPQGRIYMEEGSSLIVGGDLQGAGEKHLGSVVVCGSVEVNHAISSAIICQGSVHLPFGTASGIDVVDLAAWASDSEGTTMQTIMEDWVPNLSKIPTWLGAFEGRAPYFGRYPVVFRVFPPKPVPVPTFETLGQNYSVYLFRALSTIMASQLNLTLGENFSTTTLWWAWGGEQVAVFPKSAAVGSKDEIAAAIEAIERDLGPLAELVVDDLVGEVLDEAVDAVSDPKTSVEVLVTIAAQVVNPDPTGVSATLIEEQMEKLMNSGKKSEKAGDDINLRMKFPGGQDFSVFGSMRKELRKLEDAVNVLELSSGLSTTSERVKKSAQILLVECPGVLVYGKDSVTVGPEQWYDSPCVRAVGCFISRGNVQMNVRYTIGSLVSGQGSIQARELYYTPAFTRASLYVPKQLNLGGRGIGANDDYWKNAKNLKYGSKLDTQTALDIPSSQVFFQASEGWGP